MFGVIYKITNKITGERYIGQTTRSIEERWSEHCRPTSECSRLKNAIQKYGKENFEISTIVRCNNIEEMNNRERTYISLFKSLSPNGYNLTTGGLNFTLTPEQCLKRSERQMGNKNHMYGRKYTDEERKVFSERHTGRKMPAGFGENVSERQTGAKNHMYGRKLTDEEKQKISDRNIGRKHPPEYGQQISERQMGNKNHMYGRNISDEHRKILSAVNKQRMSCESERQKLSNSCTHKVKIFCFQNSKEYESISAAAKDLGLEKKRVSGVINGHEKQTKGYTFKKVEE